MAYSSSSFRFYPLLLIFSIVLTASLPAQAPGGVDVLLAKARLLEARGRMDLAAQNWREILLVDPDQTEALAGLARSAKLDGNIGEERTYLDHLRKINPRDPEIAAVENMRVFTAAERSLLDQAGRLAMRHRPDAAMKLYRRVLGSQQPPPGKWAWPFYEAEAASTGGRAEATAQLRQLCAQNPDQEVYRLWLASLLTFNAKTRLEGFQLFESIKDPATASQARAPWRQALIWEKDNPEALNAIQAYLQRYPDPELRSAADALRAKQQRNLAVANQEQGFKALRNNNLAAAEIRFAGVLRQSPDDVDAIVGLGYVRLDQRRFGEAADLFGRAHTLAPQRQDAREGYDNAQFWLNLNNGADARLRNHPEAAILAYGQALALRPMNTIALLGLANAEVQGRQFSAAAASFQQVLNLDPNDIDALSGLANLRLEEGRFDDAENLFEKARKLNPSLQNAIAGFHNAKFWGLMHEADTALKQNRPKDAAAEYRQAVLLDPTNKDALMGLANAAVRAGDYREADKTWLQLTADDPSDQSSWLALIYAQMSEGAPQAAISTSQRIPLPVMQRLEVRSDYLSEMALVYYSANQPGEASRELARALQAASTSDTDAALGTRLQIAAILMKQGKPARAIEIYLNATHVHPDNPSGWEGLVGAYSRFNDVSQAIDAVRSMPRHSYDAAMKHTGFLNSVAVLYSARGQCSEAEDFLNRSLALDREHGNPPAENTELQLAYVWMREHNYGNARYLYKEILSSDVNSSEAWRGYLIVLHRLRKDRVIVAKIPRIPRAVRTQLEAAPGFLVLEASAYSASGRDNDALPLLQAARSRYAAQRKPSPALLDIQTAWTMLTVSLDESGLADLLLEDQQRTDLTPTQRDAIQEIWSDWNVRLADRAFAAHPQLAVTILTSAGRAYPGNRNIHAALASLYLKRHDKAKALEVFQTWGMAGAQAGDYRMAAGAALSAHKSDLAEQFLRRGLAHFPTDPGLMQMVARQDIARGDYNAGESELKSALLALREPDTPESHPPAVPRTRSRAAASPLESGHYLPPLNNSGTLQTDPPCRDETGEGPAREAQIRPISISFSVAAVQNAPGRSSAGQQSQPPTAMTQAGNQNQAKQMEDEIEAIDDRNTPVIGTGEAGTGRIGDAGIDRLILSDTLFATASYTAANRVRFDIEAHGIEAYSGTPDGGSNQAFGTLPAHALFGKQASFGYSGFGQLSTKTFGLMAGTSPQGFPVHNLIGGFRFRPGNRWFTLLGVRNSVTDSLLSYAGAVDPGTGLRWGGVVANRGEVRLDSAPSNGIRYKRIGEYAAGSYSFLQGLRVPDNWSVTGNAGLYWQVVPGLTLGTNAYAMHYNKNLDFFSFGQGGYFSPQKYYLASIPISWYARHPRFEYALRFSGGIQYLHNEASPFYPVLPGSAAVTQGTYASSNNMAPNYDADIRMGYRVAPHVYFDMFATANNARNFYTQSMGFNLKFMINPIPTSTDIRVNSIPDWTGKQAFSVQ